MRKKADGRKESKIIWRYIRKSVSEFSLFSQIFVNIHMYICRVTKEYCFLVIKTYCFSVIKIIISTTPLFRIYVFYLQKKIILMIGITRKA